MSTHRAWKHLRSRHQNDPLHHRPSCPPPHERHAPALPTHPSFPCRTTGRNSLRHPLTRSGSAEKLPVFFEAREDPGITAVRRSLIRLPGPPRVPCLPLFPQHLGRSPGPRGAAAGPPQSVRDPLACPPGHPPCLAGHPPCFRGSLPYFPGHPACAAGPRGAGGWPGDPRWLGRRGAPGALRARPPAFAVVVRIPPRMSPPR